MAAIKLTKTMQELLLVKSDYTDLICVDSGYYTGGRRGSFGSRKRDAAIKLMDMGLFEHVKTHRNVHQMIGGWTSCHYSERLYRLTDAGKVMRDSLKGK
jgi:hypothetical protein